MAQRFSHKWPGVGENSRKCSRKSHHISITPLQKRAIWKKQSNRCAVCGNSLNAHSVRYKILKDDRIALPLLETMQAVCSQCYDSQPVSEELDGEARHIIHFDSWANPLGWIDLTQGV